jgi:choline dehydrogenase-like flavoprotein
MIYSRGSRHDYDRWAELGSEGWSYKDVLSYYLKSENMQDLDLAESGVWNGPAMNAYGSPDPINKKS